MAMKNQKIKTIEQSHKLMADINLGNSRQYKCNKGHSYRLDGLRNIWECKNCFKQL